MATSSSLFLSTSIRTGSFARPSLRTSRGDVSVHAVRRWPDETFASQVRRAFPEQACANVEEGRTLLDLGYTCLDVRPTSESEEGKVRNSVNIPIIIAKPIYNSTLRLRQYIKSSNKDFVKQVQVRFPKMDCKILVVCSNGQEYSIDALKALEAAGYTNLVGLKGGYKCFSKYFDAMLKRTKAKVMATSSI